MFWTDPLFLNSMANLQHVEEAPKHANMSTKALAFSQWTPNGLSTGGGAHRDPGGLPCLIPSFADACKLVSAPYSCLVMDTHRRHIALSPMFLKKKRTGIQDELNTELLRYSESLKGVPLAYDNIRILGEQGEIYDDSGYIHLNIEASFVVFQPQTGQKLLAVVNKLSVNHAGCLVHGCFNASVPKPSLVSVDTWRDAGPRIGAELEFEVSQLDADTAGVLLIRGRLNRTSVQELMALGDSSGHDVPADQQEEPDPAPDPAVEPTQNPAVEPTQNPSAGTPTPKKKKKKDKHREEEVAAVPPPSLPRGGAVLQELNGTAEDIGINNHTGEKKKRKKREKQREDAAVPCPSLQQEVAVTTWEKKDGVKEEETSSPIDVRWSDSSGYHSDKPNKKRKQVLGDDITSCFDLGPETPKAKKKKKGDVHV